jgi:hypothetical protein
VVVRGCSGSGEVLHFMHVSDHTAIANPLTGFWNLHLELVADEILFESCLQRPSGSCGKKTDDGRKEVCYQGTKVYGGNYIKFVTGNERLGLHCKLQCFCAC